jgi:NADPH:quinone reductase-like Zn-dependent oxidoreductase
MENIAEEPSGIAPALPPQMTAMRVHQFGGPEMIVAEAMPVPQPEDGEILVRVHACGVGPWDGWIRAGNSVLPQPLPLTLGSDISGVVVAIGRRLSGFRVGEAVYGVTNKRFTDGYAEYAICMGAMMARKSAALSDLEAASVPVIAVTAWQMLFDHARLVETQSVLVQGAAGNVGRFAVQLGAQAGLRVTAVASDADADAIRTLGAEIVVDRDLATDERFDAVLDLVGGPKQSELFKLLRPGGSLISAVAEPDQDDAREAGVRGTFMLVDVGTETLNELTRRFDDGGLQVFVGTVLPLSDAIKAHHMLDGAAPHAPGKIILRVRE